MGLIALDFESKPIATRPDYPPEPVGCSVVSYSGEGIKKYLAWGHPTENNVALSTARLELEMYLSSGEALVFHNAPFDCSIFEERLGLKVPWHRVHDTMLLAFLDDPFGELSLKPLAEKLLGQPPEERDAVRDWLVRHGVCRANDKQWGAYISFAPGGLVGTYAIGDGTRTLDLFEYYMSKYQSGMFTRYVYTPGSTISVEEAARNPA